MSAGQYTQNASRLTRIAVKCAVLRRLPLALLTALLTAGSLRAQSAPALADVLAHMKRYLAAYGEQYSATIATERYHQTSGFPNDPLYREALLESEFGIVRVPGVGNWIGLRDVYRVDGTAVTDRQDRLAKLFANPQEAAGTQADRIVEESARFNIGQVRRTINNPAIVLKLLDPGNEFRLRFNKSGEDNLDGVHVWVLHFFEQSLPTLIRSSRGENEPSEGRLWVEPASGRLHRADITFRNAAPGMGSFRASLNVTFQEDQRLHIWVPAKMVERYESSNIDYVGGEATYTDYRRFGVNTEENFSSTPR
jgi:hypothetical protein